MPAEASGVAGGIGGGGGTNFTVLVLSNSVLLPVFTESLKIPSLLPLEELKDVDFKKSGKGGGGGGVGGTTVPILGFTASTLL